VASNFTIPAYHKVFKKRRLFMKIALVIGHSKTSQGAVNKATKLTEFKYNEQLAKDVQQELQKENHEGVLVYRTTLAALPAQVNKLQPRIGIEFHCNASAKANAKGAEVLYWHTSTKGKKVAEILQAEIVAALGNPNRGAKPRTLGERGATQLKETNMPYVILEPFFIDNDADLKNAQVKHKELVKAIVRGIDKIIL
jgi:N-acetylmuramoyl-L-alanine amidase